MFEETSVETHVNLERSPSMLRRTHSEPVLQRLGLEPLSTQQEGQDILSSREPNSVVSEPCDGTLTAEVRSLLFPKLASVFADQPLEAQVARFVLMDQHMLISELDQSRNAQEALGL